MAEILARRWNTLYDDKECKAFFRSANKPKLGEVYDYSNFSAESTILEAMLGLVPGWVHNGESPFGDGITRIRGSVGIHKDPGMGHTLCFLYDMKPLGKNSNEDHIGSRDVEFFSNGPEGIQHLVVKEGDVLLFDADENHAWLSNWDCIVYLCTIKKENER
jgi:hypothetical protein